MIRSWSVGDIRVTRLVEYYGPTHDPAATFPDFDRARFDRHVTGLPPGHWFPELDRLAIAVQIWIVFAGPNVILIDTGVGNGKPRPLARMNRLNTLVPLWLAAAGVTPEIVTHVAMTHLHYDHIGWNTVFEDGDWVPTFPNAQYLVPKDDFVFFKERVERTAATDASLEDSLLPVFESGLVRFVDRQALVGGRASGRSHPGPHPRPHMLLDRITGRTRCLLRRCLPSPDPDLVNPAGTPISVSSPTRPAPCATHFSKRPP